MLRGCGVALVKMLISKLTLTRLCLSIPTVPTYVLFLKSPCMSVLIFIFSHIFVKYCLMDSTAELGNSALLTRSIARVWTKTYVFRSLWFSLIHSHLDIVILIYIIINIGTVIIWPCCIFVVVVACGIYQYREINRSMCVCYLCSHKMCAGIVETACNPNCPGN